MTPARGRMPVASRVGLGRTAHLVVVAALAAAVAAACGIGAAPASVAPPSPTPAPSISASIAATAAQIRAALGAAGLQLTVPQVPFRPGESPSVAAAPRAVYQVKLPNDQEHGFIVIYEFPDASSAGAAARELAAYVESGPGRVQFPADGQFVLRQVGTTLVFYPWSPSAATDPAAPQIAAALSTVGQGYDIRP